MKPIPKDLPVTLVLNEVTVHRNANGLVAIRVGYTVDLATEEFSGSIGGGTTGVTDEDLLRLADSLAVAIQDRINSAVGLSSSPIPAEPAQTEPDWEL
jgi:hypothetical protein